MRNDNSFNQEINFILNINATQVKESSDYKREYYFVFEFFRSLISFLILWLK